MQIQVNTDSKGATDKLKSSLESTLERLKDERRTRWPWNRYVLCSSAKG